MAEKPKLPPAPDETPVREEILAGAPWPPVDDEEAGDLNCDIDVTGAGETSDGKEIQPDSLSPGTGAKTGNQQALAEANAKRFSGKENLAPSEPKEILPVDRIGNSALPVKPELSLVDELFGDSDSEEANEEIAREWEEAREKYKETSSEYSEMIRKKGKVSREVARKYNEAIRGYDKAHEKYSRDKEKRRKEKARSETWTCSCGHWEIRLTEASSRSWARARWTT